MFGGTGSAFGGFGEWGKTTTDDEQKQKESEVLNLIGSGLDSTSAAFTPTVMGSVGRAVGGRSAVAFCKRGRHVVEE